MREEYRGILKVLDDVMLRSLWTPWHYEHDVSIKAKALVRYDRAIDKALREEDWFLSERKGV